MHTMLRIGVALYAVQDMVCVCMYTHAQCDCVHILM